MDKILKVFFKVSLVLGLFVFMFLFGGCETVKGFGKGVGATIEGTAEGVSKDSSNLWKGLVNASDWVDKNTW